jgi:hypothetical protein
MPEFEAEQESRLGLWLLGLVALALLVWAAAELTNIGPADRERAAEPATPGAPVDTAAPAPHETTVTGASFQVWVRDSAEISDRMGAQEYVAAGLQRMTAAVWWLADMASDPELRRRADEIRTGTGAGRIDAPDPAQVRQIFIAAAALVTDINQHAAEPSPAAVRHAEQAYAIAESIEPDLPLERQRHRVFSYFDFMGGAIDAAAGASRALRP